MANLGTGTFGALQIEPRGDREIIMTRAFAAPRELVFDAMTRPALLKRWLGVFGEWTMPLCEVDLRVGGTYRYVWHGPNGAVMGVRGVYEEITPPARIVATEAFDQSWYPGTALDTMEFVERDGVTTLTMTVRYESKDARDAVLASGMESGLAAGYDNMDSVLADVQSRDTIAGRYQRRADAFERKVVAVRPEEWANPSPCAEWQARDVVRHIVMMHAVMLRPLGRELSAAPSVDDDPLAAFRAARADVETVLHDRALAGAEHDWYTGRLTSAAIVDQVVSADLVWHGWDLARATGQDDTIDPVEVANAGQGVGNLDDSVLRQPGVLGPALDPPADADAQTRLLAFMGRKAW
jgi:uncharacterized protein (TIGR03086 family)